MGRRSDLSSEGRSVWRSTGADHRTLVLFTIAGEADRPSGNGGCRTTLASDGPALGWADSDSERGRSVSGVDARSPTASNERMLRSVLPHGARANVPRRWQFHRLAQRASTRHAAVSAAWPCRRQAGAARQPTRTQAHAIRLERSWEWCRLVSWVRRSGTSMYRRGSRDAVGRGARCSSNLR